MDLRNERLIRSPSSGKIARSSGEYQPMSPGCAGIGNAPTSYAASASSSLKTRETPIRSSCRQSSGDPKGDPTSAYSHHGQSGSHADPQNAPREQAIKHGGSGPDRGCPGV